MGLLDLLTLTNIALTLVTLVLAYILYMSRHYGIFKRIGVKGPSPVPVFGTFTKMTPKGLIGFDCECYEKYKKEGFYGIFEMSIPILIVTDLNAIRDISITHFHNFMDHRRFDGINSFPVSHFLSAMYGDHWKHTRGLLNPAFSSGKLKQMVPLIQSCCDELSIVMQKAADSGKEVEMKKIFGNFTMDVIAKTGFGLQTDSQKESESHFVESAKAFFANSRTILFVLLFPFLGPLLDLIRFNPVAKEHIDFFSDLTLQALKARHADTTGKYSDLIQLMADAEVNKDAELDRDEMGTESNSWLKTSTKWTTKGLTIQDIVGCGIIFIVGGYETTATTVSFAFYELALRPDILAKAQKEIDDVLKGARPTPETLAHLTYLEMVIYETLRLYPPAPRTDRICLETTAINGVTIPKGMIIQFPVSAIHKDPEIWPEPDHFIPERFTPEARADRHPMSFLAFGSGPRICIGMRLALLEAKMALATILQKYSPVRGEKTEVPLTLKKFGLTGAVNGIWLKVTPRSTE